MTAEDSAFITMASDGSVEDVVARLSAVIAQRGMKLFALIDHSAEAASVGLELRDTQLLIFGSPVGGTPAMSAHPLAAIDLPLKILVWAGSDETNVSYLAPAALAARHGLSDDEAAPLAGIGTLVESALKAAV